MENSHNNPDSQESILTPEENLRNINLILDELAQLDPTTKSENDFIPFIENRNLPTYILSPS